MPYFIINIHVKKVQIFYAQIFIEGEIYVRFP